MKPRQFDLRKWAPLLIVAAVLLAHGGALDSTFYLDDWWQVHDSDTVEGGLWQLGYFNSLTTLTHYLTWKAFGFSAFWFHAFNVLVHLGGALAVYYLGRHLLAVEERGGQIGRPSYEAVALVAALIFATHPLTTEVTNYVKARDHELMGFFAFLAAGFAALGMKRHRGWFLAAAAAMGLSTLAKGPGLPQSVLAILIVVAAFSTRERWRRIVPNRWWLYGTVFLLEIAWFILGDTGERLIAIFWQNTLQDGRFGWHALTQCRVFWNYTQLAVWPVGLSSDHLYAWTRSLADTQAWVAAGGVLALIVLTGWLWIRRCQPWAMLASLVLGTLLLRCLYVVSELMVEYRTYPAMPYVALLMAMALGCWWRRMPRTATVFGVALVITYAGISYLRSEEWSTSERLQLSILKQYPWQLRAINGLSSDDIRAKRWQKIIDRNADFSARLGAVMAENRRNPIRYYENWPLWAISEECMVTEALIHTRGPAVAEKYLMGIKARMEANKITHIVLQSEWDLTAGKVAAAKGDRKAAEAYFEKAFKGAPSRLIVEKEKKKAEALP